MADVASAGPHSIASGQSYHRTINGMAGHNSSFDEAGEWKKFGSWKWHWWPYKSGQQGKAV
jgi:hypothetical protein